MESTSWSRVVSLIQGVAMVVTDLHGDWNAYRICRDKFIQGYQRGDIQYLIFSGDLIHRESVPGLDKSLEIVLDLIKLRQSYPDNVICLLGNHEMPHIYGITLAKGAFVYTPRFEAEMGEHRQAIISFFKELPFYVRTKAGVAITHAGASAPQSIPQNCKRIFDFSHQTVFERVEKLLAGKNLDQLRNGMAKLSGESYEEQAKRYLAVSGPDDPRYNDLLRGFLSSSDPDFELLWAALFSRCEKEYGKGDYGVFLDALLSALSEGFYPQEALVAGHINIKKHYELINKRHFRFASGKHAPSPKEARYLRFDVGKPVSKPKALAGNLYPLA